MTMLFVKNEHHSSYMGDLSKRRNIFD